MIQYLTLTALGALGTEDLMTNADQGEAQARNHDYRNSNVTIAIDCNGAAAGQEFEIFAGSRQILSRSALPIGGTQGQFPNLNEQAFTFAVGATEQIRIPVRELGNVATTDINATISTTPR